MRDRLVNVLDDCIAWIKKGKPRDIDFLEPMRIKEAVKRLNLDYIVITSPTRDDLEDGGADLFVKTVAELKKLG